MSKFGCEMGQQLIVFSCEDNCPSFENFSRENGIVYWLASELAMMLGYSDMAAIRKAIDRAMSVCISSNIPVVENFFQISSDNDPLDVKMTRFACFLTVMQADISNSRVAIAQAYFAKLADDLLPTEQIDRVYLRGDISEREKTLSYTAKKHGVENYPFFQNAGYRGMYNMNIKALKNRKGLGENSKDSLLDFMNKEELAANIFRITQTESKIKNQNIKGQRDLEKAAETVGRSVRDVMIKNTGIKPEDLQLDSEKIHKVKSGIKRAHKKLTNLDKDKNKD